MTKNSENENCQYLNDSSNFYLLFLYLTVIHRYSLGWFNRIYIYSKLEVIMKTMLKAKGQKEIAHYWLYLMCFSSHTFLFPIKSFSIPSPYFLYIPIYSGAYIKSTMLSAVQLCLYIYQRTYFTVACVVYVAVVCPCDSIRICLYCIGS